MIAEYFITFFPLPLTMSAFLLVSSTATACQPKVAVRSNEKTKGIVLPDSPLEMHNCSEIMAIIGMKNFVRKEVPATFPIPSEHEVVLDLRGEDEKASGWTGTDGAFVPDVHEIDNAKQAVLRYLRTHENDNLSELHYQRRQATVGDIAGILQYYYVQIFGRIRNDRKIVALNFFIGWPPNNCEVPPEMSCVDWKEQHCGVKGGGLAYWTAYYDVQTDLLESIRVNGGR